ncbi:hypothetical protein B0T14DRAFT_457672 [Immersiella caudata]|uniref:Nephrocystin 3-like N-terminal domain-containing protein n=1 Tax=Immersiella caudata TaxID=314043 RepID=A0AA39WS40_9PEZI|nr:hypothetical protein B0T14DRAFT_457672 [Immersiella caudata]
MVAPTGLSVLHDPPSGNTNVDIVFVHGLQGHPERTWRHDDGESSQDLPASSSSAPFSKRRRMDGNPSRDTNLTRAIFWPKDLLPRYCPAARILTFGYDSVITRGYLSVDRGSIFSHSRDLLHELLRHRVNGRCIIFVAHSLGGIIVKEVLRRSDSRIAEHRDILTSTTGVVFMGTPHRGSPGLASIGDAVRKVAQNILRMNTNEQVIRALGLNSPELELCRESFVALWQTHGFQVKSFQEARPLTGVKLGFLAEKVVPDTSSSLDDPREKIETIAANHMEMCRFSGMNDPGFVKVASVLREFSKFRPVETHCSQALSFPQMRYRESAIRDPLSKTCDWLFSHDVYQRWESRSDPTLRGRFLWVKGKPGTGKSTLMKQAVRRAKLREKTEAIVIGAFFFSARGTILERSPRGMMLTLCRDLFDRDDDFKTHVIRHYKSQWELHPDRGMAEVPTAGWWSPDEEELQNLFMSGLSCRPNSAPPVVLFIDALDECEGNGARGVVRYLVTLLEAAETAGQRLELCLSSRHYPTITTARSVDIFVEDGNPDDILLYIRSKIPNGIMPDSRAVDILRNLILEKSSGIFLWVVMVIDDVLRDVDEGKAASEIEQSLEEVPGDLLPLFSTLIGTIRPNERPAAVRLIQWILLSNTAIPLKSLHAILVCSDDTIQTLNAGYGEQPRNSLELSLVWDIDLERMKRNICSISRGLIEVKVDRLGTHIVQFIHESVREFFFTEGHLLFQSPNFLNIGRLMIIKTLAHALCLPRLIKSHRLFDQSQGSRFGASLDIEFLWYLAAEKLRQQAIEARQNVMLPVPIIHLAGRVTAILARRGASSQRRPRWRSLLREAEQVAQVRGHGMGPHIECDNQLTSCAVTLALACSRLVSALEHNQSVENSSSIAGFPFPVLEATHMDWKTPPYSNHDGIQAAYFGSSDTPFELQLRQRKEHEAVAKLRRLASIVPKLDLADNEGNTVLHTASWLGMTAIVKMLLDYGCSPNVLNYYEMSPLLLACQYGHLEVVRLLLEAGADPGMRGPEGYTPLHLAVESSNSGVVDLLITHGADILATDSHRSTPLHVASKFQACERVKNALIRVGADRDAVDKDFLTPIQISLFYGFSDGLIISGAHINGDRMLSSAIGNKNKKRRYDGSIEVPPSAWEPPPRPKSSLSHQAIIRAAAPDSEIRPAAEGKTDIDSATGGSPSNQTEATNISTENPSLKAPQAVLGQNSVFFLPRRDYHSWGGGNAGYGG